MMKKFNNRCQILLVVLFASALIIAGATSSKSFSSSAESIPVQVVAPSNKNDIDSSFRNLRSGKNDDAIFAAKLNDNHKVVAGLRRGRIDNHNVHHRILDEDSGSNNNISAEIDGGENDDNKSLLFDLERNDDGSTTVTANGKDYVISDDPNEWQWWVWAIAVAVGLILLCCLCKCCCK